MGRNTGKRKEGKQITTNRGEKYHKKSGWRLTLSVGSQSYIKTLREVVAYAAICLAG